MREAGHFFLLWTLFSRLRAPDGHLGAENEYGPACYRRQKELRLGGKGALRARREGFRLIPRTGDWLREAREEAGPQDPMEPLPARRPSRIEPSVPPVLP